MKIYFTYGTETREGLESRIPLMTKDIPADSVDEIQGENVLEKVPDLIAFIDECYRLLRVGSKAIFSAPHYGHVVSWQSPLTKRAIGERSLNFADKTWREANKYTEAVVMADFEVAGQFAVEEACLQRSDDARFFWMQRYLNVAQAVLFTLTKR